ncbi:MAG: hypothetical protein AAEC03_10940 [Synechococcus sp.]
MAPLYVRNRRDGSRLLSSVVVIFTIAATQIPQPWAVIVVAVSSVICIYWGFAYCRLER